MATRGVKEMSVSQLSPPTGIFDEERVEQVRLCMMSRFVRKMLRMFQPGHKFVATNSLRQKFSDMELNLMEVKYSKVMDLRKNNLHYRTGWNFARRINKMKYDHATFLFPDVSHLKQEFRADTVRGFNDFFTLTV